MAFVVFAGLGRRQILAPLVVGPGGGNLAVLDLRWLRPAGSTASAAVALEKVAPGAEVR
jgi:hypothetical protein